MEDNHISNKTRMEEINLFRKKSQQHLPWNAARLACMSIFLSISTYSRVRENPTQERSQGEAPQWVFYSYLWRV